MQPKKNLLIFSLLTITSFLYNLPNVYADASNLGDTSGIKICCRMPSGEAKYTTSSSCGQNVKVDNSACESNGKITGTYYSNNVVTKSTSLSVLPSNIRTEIAKKTGKNETEITNITLTSRTSTPKDKQFINVISSGRNNIRLSYNTTAFKTLSNDNSNELRFTFNLTDGKKYMLIYTVKVGDKASSDTSEDTTKYCWYNKNTNKYSIMTKAEKAASKYVKFFELKENISLDDCLKNDKTSGTETTTTTTTTSNSSTNNSNTGKNACTEYTIKRVRGYNTKYNGITNLHDTYFHAPVKTSYDYYYVYKAYASCTNFDSQTEITAFCVDPGLEGASSAGTSYHASEKKVVNKDGTKFERGIYWLYTHWYLENADNIKNTYSGTSPTGGADFLDYVVNNVSRMLVANYGEEFGISFGLKIGQNGNTSKWSKEEYDAYMTKEFNPLNSLNSNAKNKLLEVWNNVKDYAEGKITEDETSEEEINLKVEAGSPTILNNNRGFEIQFAVKLKSSNTNLLDEAIASKNITLQTKSGININVSDSELTLVSDWTTDSDGYKTATYKLHKEDIAAELGSDTSVSLRFNINYTSRKSLDNILILEANSQNASSGGTYQKFITFLNGRLSKYDGVDITITKDKNNTCKAAYAMICTSDEHTFYLIEGTQTGTLYNTVMSGINSLSDLKELITNASSIIDYLKNHALTSLNISDIKIISSLLYNIADSTGIVRTVKQELLSPLLTLSNNGNTTAKNLYNSLSGINFTSDSKNNNQILISLVTSTILNGLTNYDKTVKEVEEIVTAINDSNASKQTKKFIENISNAVKSAGNITSLKNVLNGSASLSDYFSSFTDITKIQSSILSFGSVSQTIVSTVSENLNDISKYINNMLTEVTKAFTLGDVSTLMDSLKNAITVNWQNCIIGDGTEATDPNGNSYTVKSANDYCSIVCKEDYAIKTPGNLGTAYAGRYISTNLDNVYHATIGVAGQRTCVTTSIDNEKYLNDATDAKQKLLDSYNAFMESYMKFKNLNNYDIKSLEEQAKEDPTPVDTDSLLSSFKSNMMSSAKSIVDVFIGEVVGSKTSESFLNFQSDMLKNIGDLGMGLAVKWINNGGKIDSKDIQDGFQTTVEKSFGDQYNDFKERIDKAIEKAEKQFEIEAKNLLETMLKESLKAVADLAGKAIITTACNAIQALDGVVPGLGTALQKGCDAYSIASKYLKEGITEVNTATQSTVKVFNQISTSRYNYYYDTYKFNDSSSKQTILSSDFVIDQEGLTKTAETKGDRREIWIMNAETRYTINSLHFGAYFNYTNLENGFKSLGKIGGDLYDASGEIQNAFEKVETAYKSFTNINLGSLLNIVNIGENFGNISSTINSIFETFDNISSQTLGDVTTILDDGLDIYFYFRGAFDPYYATLASIREEMRTNKEAYEAARKDLTIKANNMNSCTIWSQEFKMNPEITFTYGYTNNNLLDYIISKRDSTTDQIKLEAINHKTTPDIATYYCYGDVDINNMQSFENLLNGTCVTDDYVIGSVIAALFGDDNILTKFSNFLEQNASGIKTLLNNSKVQTYLQSNQAYQDFSNYVCNISQALCNYLDMNENNTVNTYIPGALSYGVDNNVFKTIMSSIKNNNFGAVKESVSKILHYTTLTGDTIKYRNIKRMATISRYGNPGVDISGVSLKTVLYKYVNWLSSKFDLDKTETMTKINDVLKAISGQEFIYYKSSQEYFTYGNKGIYTKTKTTDDSVLVDIGDTNLTDDNIKSGTTNDKKADGRIYPIALATKEGSYSYQIKINNIGQYYNNSYALGRIIDDNGYMSGLLANQYVCKYEVKSSPCDPTVEECDNKPTCKTIYNSDLCKDSSGYFQSQYLQNKNYDNEQKWSACLTKLLENKCCDLVTDSSSVPDSKKEDYNTACPIGPCKGFKIYNYTTSDGSSKNDPNAALITKNGTLNFTTKVVSNNNMFPNGDVSKSFNYKGTTSGYENKDENGKPQPQEISKIIEQWEEKGDSIYDADADFSIDLNAACIAKIKSYNDEQEKIDLGFGDYTLGSISKESREYKSKFLQDLRENPGTCVIKEKTTN